MGRLLIILIFVIIFFLIWISYQAGRYSSSRKKIQKWENYKKELFLADIDKLAERIIKKKSN